ncbi:MAG: tetratricopeptide repeat protein [Nitrospiria bacterium]
MGGILVVAALLYLPALDHPFQYDDGHTIVDQAALRQPGAWRAALTGTSLSSAEIAGGHYRPLTYLSYWATLQLAGLSPRAFHAGNLLLHLLAVWLIVRLVTAITADARVGLASGALFAIHPALSEAVLYASARAGLLATVCSLAALSSFLRARARQERQRPAGGTWVGFAVWTLLALLSKETAVALPILCLAADGLRAAGRPLSRRSRWGPYLGLAAALIGYAAWIGLWPRASLLSLSGIARSLGVAADQWPAIGLGARLFLWPSPLSVDHLLPGWPAPAAIAYGLLALALLVFGLLNLRAPSASSRPAGFFAMWVIIASLPTLLWPLNVPFQEHRAYGPDVGLAALAAIGLVRAADAGAGWRAMVWSAALLAAVLGAWQVVERGRVWDDPVRLWDDARRVSPASYRSQAHAGLALAASGHWDEADRAFDAALILRPAYPPALVGRGVSAHRRGDYALAGDCYRRALETAPDYVPALYNLGLLAQQTGEPLEAERRYRQALAINPSHPESLTNLRALSSRPTFP